MKTAVTSPRKVAKERQQWQGQVEQLARQVESWAKERGWAVHRDSKRIEESQLGAYDVPFLSIQAPSGPVHLDPIARYVAKASGRVDLSAWPSFNRMLLIRMGGEWKIKTDSGIPWPEKWNQETFARMVELLNTAE